MNSAQVRSNNELPGIQRDFSSSKNDLQGPQACFVKPKCSHGIASICSHLSCCLLGYVPSLSRSHSWCLCLAPASSHQPAVRSSTVPASTAHAITSAWCRAWQAMTRYVQPQLALTSGRGTYYRPIRAKIAPGRLGSEDLAGAQNHITIVRKSFSNCFPSHV